ncbi:hypothetical protein HK103_001767, partial [Boothiomyces macroporosus]
RSNILTAAHSDGIWSVAWSKKQNKIVTGSVDDTVKLWNGDTMTPMHTFTGHQLGVISVDISPNGACIQS